MATWGNVCRICTSPAEYEIFEKIPAYLHATSNEFLNWQKPINVLLEETTGLKFSTDDPLPNKICALCVSYLKHAVIFREQCINNTLGLKAVGLLRQQNQKNKTTKPAVDKDSLLITAQELNFSEERQIDTNLLSNNCQQEQDKVCKQLLNNSFQATAPTQQNIEQQLRYLNLLFDKDTNTGLYHARRNNSGAAGFEAAAGSAGDPYAEEDFQTATSSDENEGGGTLAQKHNIFSYKEKNFEEDDVMDVDELRNAITINIPESCKERKCRACFRRFMFEESFSEHMSVCIEYKFLTYIEEMNRLLDIRRSKAISPHEFVRRMIFCIRKTCEWLKKANCGDMLLPDLVQGSSAENKAKGRLESEGKSSAASSSEQKQPIAAHALSEKLRKRFDIPIQSDKLTDILLTTITPKSENPNTNTITKLLLKDDDSATIDYFKTPRPIRNDTTTPISISNNILYEIERSQSRNSSIHSNLEDVNRSGQQVKKPIALFATNNSSTETTTVYNTTLNDAAGHKNNTERLTFLQKLQQAAKQTETPVATPVSVTDKMLHATPLTPIISVRKDLLPGIAYATSPAENQQQVAYSAAIPIKRKSLSFSARCNPCNLLFETLASLEVHNAMHHNHLPTTPQGNRLQPTMPETSEEHKRIIALFEEDDADTA